MEYDLDPAKDEANFDAHGSRLSDFGGFDVEPTVVEDRRVNYGERRLRAFGRIGGKGYCLAFTVRGSRLRLISYRRGHEKEMRRYE